MSLLHDHRLKWHLKFFPELILTKGFHLKFILFSRAIAGFGDGLMYPVNNAWTEIPLQRYSHAFKRWSLSMWLRLPVRVCGAQWTMWQISHRWQNPQMYNMWSMWSQNIGLVLLYMFSLHLTWRPLAALLIAFPAVAMACLIPLPETPYWLARSNTCDSRLLPLSCLKCIFHPVH